MLRSRFEWTVLTIIALLLGGAWVLMSREAADAPADSAALSAAPLPGYLPPAFTLDTTGGETYHLADFQGRPVVLNFWATWCGPCRAEMPDLQAASETFADQVVFLGINQGESPAQIDTFQVEFGLTYPLLVDQSLAVNQLYRVRALPTTVFVGADGVIREVYTGILSEGILQDRVERLLADGGAG